MQMHMLTNKKAPRSGTIRISVVVQTNSYQEHVSSRQSKSNQNTIGLNTN
jgi:hypothetical protein